MKRDDYYRVGRVKISITNENKAIQFIKDTIHDKNKGYVCISNMRTVSIANKDDKYQEVMENSLMNTPDGTPLVWCGHWWGLKEIERACGPHIFLRMLKDTDSTLKHFFLGDTDDTLKVLTEKATKEFGATVVGSYSPPFKPLEEYDIEGMAKMINESGATIVWTSLRAPKQDILSSMIVPYLNNGIVMVGVGAAFRIILGNMPQPDGFLQKLGLVGLLYKRPNISAWENFKWYLETSICLLKFFCMIKYKRFMGCKPYDY